MSTMIEKGVQIGNDYKKIVAKINKREASRKNGKVTPMKPVQFK